MEITEALQNNSPNLSVSSLKTYSSVLRNLPTKMNGEGLECLVITIKIFLII